MPSEKVPIFHRVRFPLDSQPKMPPIPGSITITPVKSEEDLAATIRLFELYAISLGIDLSFQDFATEMASMPGKYSPDAGGALFLARRAETHEAIGCVGLRSLTRELENCEMKRLYVDPAGRGLGVGKALAEAVVDEARRLQYKAVLLDTLRTMAAARALYASLGFAEIEAYYHSPLKEDSVFLRKELGN